MPGLFRRRLAERLRWARESDLAEQQRELASQYLNRRDFVRVAMFGWEACVTRVRTERGVSTLEFDERKEAVDSFETELREGKHPVWRRNAHWTLKIIRNALAHGTPPQTQYRWILNNPDHLGRELRDILRHLLG